MAKTISIVVLFTSICVQFGYSLILVESKREKILECSGPKKPPQNEARGTNPTIATWPKDEAGFVIVPYAIDDSLSDAGRKAVELSITEYKRNTCIFLRPKDQFDINFVSFQDDSTGCWSYLGRIGGKQEISLEDGGCTDAMGTTLHEIAHAIGVHHEHSRPDRDEHVIVYTDNIISGMESNFEIENDIHSYGSSYDFLSMMHYPSIAFAIDGTKTILKRDDLSTITSQRNGFSQSDIEQINLLYECDGVKEGNVLENPTSCYHADDNGMSYRGDVRNVTITGVTHDCEPWVNHWQTSLYYNNDLRENLCRNPNPMIYSAPVCTVRINGVTSLKECGIQECMDEPESTSPIFFSVTDPPLTHSGSRAHFASMILLVLYFLLSIIIIWPYFKFTQEASVNAAFAGAVILITVLVIYS